MAERNEPSNDKFEDCCAALEETRAAFQNKIEKSSFLLQSITTSS